MKTEFDEHKAKGAACLLKQPIEPFVKGAKWEFNKNVARDAKLRENLKEEIEDCNKDSEDTWEVGYNAGLKEALSLLEKTA